MTDPIGGVSGGRSGVTGDGFLPTRSEKVKKKDVADKFVPASIIAQDIMDSPRIIKSVEAYFKRHGKPDELTASDLKALKEAHAVVDEYFGRYAKIKSDEIPADVKDPIIKAMACCHKGPLQSRRDVVDLDKVSLVPSDAISKAVIQMSRKGKSVGVQRLMFLMKVAVAYRQRSEEDDVSHIEDVKGRASALGVNIKSYGDIFSLMQDGRNSWASMPSFQVNLIPKAVF